MMWLVWLCAGSFGVGYVTGTIARIIIDWRQFSHEQEAIKAQQAYIRKLKDERKSLLWQNRMGRGL